MTLERSFERIKRRVLRFLTDDQATSDIEYILLTATIVFMLFVIPPMIIRANSIHFRRLSLWINFPFP